MRQKKGKDWFGFMTDRKLNQMIQGYRDSYRLAFRENRNGLLRSRKACLWGNLAASTATQMIAGNFYTTLLLMLTSPLNSEDKTRAVALLSVVASVSAMFQVLSPVLFEKLRRRMPLIFLLRGLFYAAQVIGYPLVIVSNLDPHGKVIWFAVLAAVSGISNALASPALGAWHIHSLPLYCRFDFYTIFTAVGTVWNALLGFLLGLFMDYFTAHQIQLAGVMAMRGLSLFFIAWEYQQFSRIVEPDYFNGEKAPRLKDILLVPLRTPAFRIVLLIYMSYCFFSTFQGQYYSMYLLDEAGAGFRYAALNLVSIVGIPCSLLALPVWNRWIHKYGWMKIMAISLALYSGSFFLNVFVTSGTRYMYFVSHIYGQFVICGSTLGWSNFPHSHAPKRMLTASLALYNVLGSLASVLAAKGSEFFMLKTEDWTWHIFRLDLLNDAYINTICGLGILFTAVLIALFSIKNSSPLPGSADPQDK